MYKWIQYHIVTSLYALSCRHLGEGGSLKDEDQCIYEVCERKLEVCFTKITLDILGWERPWILKGSWEDIIAMVPDSTD